MYEREMTVGLALQLSDLDPVLRQILAYACLVVAVAWGLWVLIPWALSAIAGRLLDDLSAALIASEKEEVADPSTPTATPNPSTER